MNSLPLAMQQDARVVMTFDAGGSSFRFSARRGGQPATDTVVPPRVAELKGSFIAPDSTPFRRLASVAYGREDDRQRRDFLASSATEVVVPISHRKVRYQAARKIGVGLSHLGTSEAIAVGAYAFALGKLDQCRC